MAGRVADDDRPAAAAVTAFVLAAAVARASPESVPEMATHGDHSECARCIGIEKASSPDAESAAGAAGAANAYEAPKPQVLTDAQRAQLASWDTTQTINPKTNHQIAFGGPTHKSLTREYQILRDAADASLVRRTWEADKERRAADEAEARAQAIARVIQRTQRERRSCELLSMRVLVKVANREVWTASVKLGERQGPAPRATCRGCEGAVKLSVVRRDGAELGGSCQWSAECEACAWTLHKTYKSFTTPLTTLAEYVRGPGAE